MIGDINSQERGTGARYNTGKPDLSLIPLWIIAAAEYAVLPDTLDKLVFEGWAKNAGVALEELSRFQLRLDGDMALLRAVCLMHRDWDSCAEVFNYGRRKYAAWNWARGMPWSAVIASCARHLRAMMQGDETDAESGLPHRGHVLCNLVMLISYENIYKEGDDRPTQFVKLDEDFPELSLSGEELVSEALDEFKIIFPEDGLSAQEAQKRPEEKPLGILSVGGTGHGLVFKGCHTSGVTGFTTVSNTEGRV